MLTKIYLDLDGVLANQQDALIARLNLPAGFIWPEGVWNITEATGVPAREVWSKLADHEFWADDIKPLPYAYEFYNTAVMLVGVENVRILSKPTRAPFSASGKTAWVQKHFPKLTDQIILTGLKDECSGSNRLLLDDKIENCHEWRGNRGYAVLCPARWNMRYNESPLAAIDDMKEYAAI